MRFLYQIPYLAMLSIVLTGCSDAPSIPTPERSAAATLKLSPKATPDGESAAAKPRRTDQQPTPELRVKSRGGEDLSDQPPKNETPCSRGEPGWKFHGNLVVDGKCVVGPCDCTQEQ